MPTAEFSSRPSLVFWEATRACPLSCVHCRASAITDPLPGELSTEEGMKLIDQVTAFGEPYPTVIFTGGDPLKRSDLFELMAYAADSDIRFAVSPAVSELLNRDMLRKIRDMGTSSISVSLDGASPQTHDRIRRKEGTYVRTIEAVRNAISIGLRVQVNTTVMKGNSEELPAIFHIIRGLGVETWEIFFLIKTGRGSYVDDLTPIEYENVCNLLYDASRYDMTVRCVEAPFVRRIAKQRLEQGHWWDNEDYRELRSNLAALEGEPATHSSIRMKGTLDGDGIIFVSYDGTVHPGGFLPIPLGSVKRESLARIYRENDLLKRIRERKMNGYCGICEFSKICGGSRARAYAYNGDPLSTDPACIYAVQHKR